MALNLAEALSHRWLAAPLGVWGKLPSHGDFLRHRCSAAQAQDWQDWVGRVWTLRAPASPVRRARKPVRSEAGWLTLEPRKVAVDLARVPVAFVMPPGALPFSPRHCVQGVMLASEDQIGRPCPLIVFQQITPGWLRRTWVDRPGLQQHDILYWLARITARAHAAERSWEELTQAVDGVWQAHAPGWRQLLGLPLAVPAQEQLELLLRSYCAHETADAARGLRGVQRLPWTDWPAQFLRTGIPAAHAFWQQDLGGAYVNAGANLSALLGVRT